MLDLKGTSRLSVWQWWKYYLGAKTRFNSQSFHLHQFYLDVLNQNNVKSSPTLQRIEERRSWLLQNEEYIVRNDLGAGGHTGKEQKVSTIAKTQLSDKNQGLMLYQLVQKFKKANILELGTSLGLSSAYLAAFSPDHKIHTVEGDASIAQVASNTHQALGLKNIKIYQGSIQDFLDQNNSTIWDIVFMDADHTYQSTISYYHQIRNQVHDESIILLDDVMWSKGMNRAWNEIRHSGTCTASLQYEGLGILFFSQKFIEPVHENWLHWKWKPHTKFLTW